MGTELGEEVCSGSSVSVLSHFEYLQAQPKAEQQILSKDKTVPAIRIVPKLFLLDRYCCLSWFEFVKTFFR